MGEPPEWLHSLIIRCFNHMMLQLSDNCQIKWIDCSWIWHTDSEEGMWLLGCGRFRIICVWNSFGFGFWVKDSFPHIEPKESTSRNSKKSPLCAVLRLTRLGFPPVPHVIVPLLQPSEYRLTIYRNAIIVYNIAKYRVISCGSKKRILLRGALL